MLSVRHVTKTYRKQGREIHAVHDVSFEVEPGEFVVVHGPSGSGKSTLLLLLGGMLPPDAGEVRFESSAIYGWSPGRRNRFRKRTVGFVFQRYFLVPYLSVLDNIRLPLAIQGETTDSRDEIRRLAGRLRIEDRLDHRPGELSAGEQQRAAVARAMVGGKRLILADEPTGNLDTPNAEIIAQCLTEERERGRTILLVTHDRSLLGIGTREWELVEGRLLEPSAAE
jgi:putative ABC transport system ATP-binding protein